MLTTQEILASLSEGLASPITRTLFQQSIRPLMQAEGDAEKHGPTWLFEERYLWQWRVYLQGREKMIAQGRWNSKRPYSIEDRDMIAHDIIQVGDE